MFYTHHFENGLVLLAEPMDAVESAAFSLHVPCGTNNDPEDRIGLAEMLCDMTLRGAGARDSRALIQAIENLGCERSESVFPAHTVYGAATLASNLILSLEILADIVRRPFLPEEQLEEARQIAFNEILAVQDDPARLTMLELERNFHPDPWGRSSIGTTESIKRITIEDIREQHERFFQPDGAILSLAGRFDWPELLQTVSRLFSDWTPRKRAETVEREIGSQNVHIFAETAQTHIGLAYPTVPFSHPDYLKAWSAVGLLSGGMSSRLFHEIREKRGLCYTVGATYATLPHRGAVFCYCGTGVERADQSLEVLVAELRRLSEGIDEAELDRLKIRAKSTLVMRQESTAARSAALARDWYYLGRLRSMDEIESSVNRISKAHIDAFLHENPAGPFHIAILGPKKLTAPF
ncbi:MAG TPA: insulinase family protein [Planctomycetaceae bacterium]|nr:insulinase family protein [Planctomycetaceae bacterium]